MRRASASASSSSGSASGSPRRTRTRASATKAMIRVGAVRSAPLFASTGQARPAWWRQGYLLVAVGEKGILQ